MNPKDFSTLQTTKLLLEQFDIVLKDVRKHLEKLKFKRKGIGSPQLNLTHNIYRLRFEFELKSYSKSNVFYDAGFGFGKINGKDEIWVYADFVLPNKKYNDITATKIAKLLPSYDINKNNKEVRQIVKSKLLIDFTKQKNGSIDKQKVINWFEMIIGEAKVNEKDIAYIIEHERL